MHALKPFVGSDFDLMDVTCSAHKEPERALSEMRRLTQRHPDSVILTYVGKSNAAAGLMFAARNPKLYALQRLVLEERLRTANG